jgi:excisionase family DNA binding protein
LIPEKSVSMTSTQRTHRQSPSRVTPVAVEPEANRMALSVPQTAWLLGTSPNFVWGILAKGELGSFHLGRKRMIARSEVERFIAAGGTHDDAEAG